MDSIISVDATVDAENFNQTVDRVFTITDFIPKITVKSESQFIKEKEELTNQINKIQERINEIDKILNN